jgi:3-isopropylmalate/(R)-2-methylmalate dehydratase large subunit
MQPKPRKMLIHVAGDLQLGVTPKDVALYIISKLSTRRYWLFCGARKSFEDMTMEGMTVCNLSIEMGARRNDCPRSNDFDYLEGRLYAPKGAAWDTAVAYWKTLKTDADAKFDEEINFDF